VQKATPPPSGESTSEMTYVRFDVYHFGIMGRRRSETPNAGTPKRQTPKRQRGRRRGGVEEDAGLP
jgi:hypothetical protein